MQIAFDLFLKKIKKHLSYNPTSGAIFWLVPTANRVAAGSVAGTKDKNGYICIRIFGKKLFAHRLAWFLSFDSWPKQDIDHINGNASDNRISNLRVVSKRKNNTNRRSHRAGRLFGATYKKRSKSWESQIQIGKRKIHLGTFSSEEDAHAAYVAALEKVEGRL